MKTLPALVLAGTAVAATAGGAHPDASARSRGLDLRTAVMVDEVTASPRRLFSLAISPNGHYLAAAGEEGVIRLWTLPALRDVRDLKRSGGPFYQVEFSGDGRLLLVMGAGGRALTALSVPEGTEVFSIGPVVASLHGFAPSPDGKHVAAFVEGAIRIYQLPKGVEERAFPSADDPVTLLAYSKDGRCLASAHPGTLRLWDVETGTQRLSVTVESRQISGIAFHPDGQRFAVAEHSGAVQVWDGRGKSLFKVTTRSLGPCALAFSPDGQTLILGDRDGSIRSWEAQGGREIRQIEAHNGIAYGAVFHPDGRRLFTAGSDGKIKLWAPRPSTPPRRPPFLGFERDESSEGVVVLSVLADSPAARAGLQAGDSILDFGGTKISGVQDLMLALRRFAAGDEVTLRITRKGAAQEIKVTLGAAPDER